MKTFFKTYSTPLTHILCWTIFITYEILFITTITGKAFGFSDYFLPYLINISLFYFHSGYVLGSGHKAQRPLPILIPGLILELLAYLLIIKAVADTESLIKGIRPVFFHFDKLAVLRSLWRGVYFILLSTAYWFARRSLAQQRQIAGMEYEKLKNLIEKKELEKNLIRSDNAYLRSQVNPHLLFNTLNFIYGAIYEISAEAAQSVILLSDIMRYSLNEINDDGKVPLNHEILHIKNYIAITELRKKNRLGISIFLQEDCGNQRIIPLILMTLVENLLMHADTDGNTGDAYLHIACEGNLLTYTSQNRKKQYKTPGHGIGLSNVRERLKTYYPHGFELELDDTPDFYRLNLQILL
ncbi:sensor histidine kinase [Mucilaginibacter endophyticus]|uniref:sensor histidine kinase n=1 Tax=Mucilaginibacter endophyticus TaxID=2675003 RepID=UPI000E0CDC6E|nr:histidine kinase [Mucilaginibacter endophyticus]